MHSIVTILLSKVSTTYTWFELQNFSTLRAIYSQYMPLIFWSAASFSVVSPVADLQGRFVYILLTYFMDRPSLKGPEEGMADLNSKPRYHKRLEASFIWANTYIFSLLGSGVWANNVLNGTLFHSKFGSVWNKPSIFWRKCQIYLFAHVPVIFEATLNWFCTNNDRLPIVQFQTI